MTLTIQALCHCATRAIRAINPGPPASAQQVDATDTQGGSFVVTTSEVQQAILDAAGEEELGSERVPAYKVGRILAQMRLGPEARPGGKGSRRRRVTFEDLERWKAAYGVWRKSVGIGPPGADPHLYGGAGEVSRRNGRVWMGAPG